MSLELWITRYYVAIDVGMMDVETLLVMCVYGREFLVIEVMCNGRAYIWRV